jgi:hypothetical protein
VSRATPCEDKEKDSNGSLVFLTGHARLRVYVLAHPLPNVAVASSHCAAYTTFQKPKIHILAKANPSALSKTYTVQHARS